MLLTIFYCDGIFGCYKILHHAIIYIGISLIRNIMIILKSSPPGLIMIREGGLSAQPS
jgi:hypothetical protein